MSCFVIYNWSKVPFFLFMQLIYDKSKFKNNFFVGMSSNVSSVLNELLIPANQKELTDKQPLFSKAVVDIARLLLYPKGSYGKTVKMCDIQK
jgi:hypothetical protein